MSKKGLIGVQMSTIAPAKMPSFEPFEVMGKLVDLGYHCAEVSQVPMTKENVAGFRRAIDELGFNISSLTASVAPMFPAQPGEYLSNLQEDAGRRPDPKLRHVPYRHDAHERHRQL